MPGAAAAASVRAAASGRRAQSPPVPLDMGTEPGVCAGREAGPDDPSLPQALVMDGARRRLRPELAQAWTRAFQAIPRGHWPQGFAGNESSTPSPPHTGHTPSCARQDRESGTRNRIFGKLGSRNTCTL